MFAVTMDRVKNEIYERPPPVVAKTLLRWILTHPDYARRYTALVTRELDPAQFLPPPVMLGIAAKGALARVRARLRPGPDPTAPLRV